MMSGGDAAFDWSAATRDVLDLDTTTPSMPRLWNFWAHGKDNFEADQRFGTAVLEHHPQILDATRFRTCFRSRAVRALVGEYGIRQLLVAGVDLPLRDDEVHDIAQRVAPLARVMYADTDPLVMAHARALLTSRRPGGCAHVDAGVRDPDALLEGAGVALDLTEPVGVLLINSMDGLDDTAAAHTMGVLHSALPGGSAVAICHLTGDTGLGLAALGAGEAKPIPGLPHPRTPAGVRGLLAGWDLVEPGVVAAPRWRPEPSPWPPPDGVDLWCGVGRICGPLPDRRPQ